MAKRSRARARAAPAVPETQVSAKIADPGREWTPILAGLAAILGAAAYLGTLTHPFVYDDEPAIYANPSIRSLNVLTNVLRGSTRPLTNLTYAVNWAMSEANPVSYHVTNIVLHMINVLLLFCLGGYVFRDQDERMGHKSDPGTVRLMMFTSAALFAVHPMMSEAVGYASARAGVLSLTFILSSLLAMRNGMKSNRWTYVAIALACYLLGVASKETAAMLPFVFLAYDYLLLPSNPEQRRRRLYRLHLPFFVFTVVAAGWRLHSYLSLETHTLRSEWQSLFTQFGVLWRYLALLLLPIGQSFFHSVNLVEGAFEPIALLSGVGLLGLLSLAYYVRRKAPLMSFGCVWFVLLLTPSSVVPLLEHMAEHRVYEASVGFFLIVAGLVGSMQTPSRVARASWLFLVSATLVVLLVATVLRNQVWASPISLWQDAVEKGPDVWVPRYALGDAYREQGDCERAMVQYRAAISILSIDARAHLNLGVCLAQQNQLDAAIVEFEEAHRLDPKDPSACRNLGLAELNRHHPEAALKHLQKALELDPSSVKTRQDLVGVYQTALHNSREVVRLCREIKQLAPDTPHVDDCIRDAEAALGQGSPP